jgi:hypothetical protein
MRRRASARDRLPSVHGSGRIAGRGLAPLASSRGRQPVMVEFVARDGAAVTVECSSCGPELVEGDTVRIRYDPSSPDSDVEAVGNRGNRRVALFALAMVAGLSVVAGITASWTRRTGA